MNSDESNDPSQNQSQNETPSVYIPKSNFVLTDHELRKRRSGTVILATLKPSPGEPGTPSEVAAKRINADQLQIKPTGLASLLDREAPVWSSWSHENILRFIGYYIEEDLTTAYLFSPYMRNGNARNYLVKKQSTIEERFSLLNDTLMGLDYLHNLSPPVVHGGLRTSNVLINDNCQAVLSNCYRWTQIDDADEWTRDSNNFYVIRWYSPELFPNPDKTTSSDIWAWGCLAFEIMTGNFPFGAASGPSDIRGRILSGETPEPTPPPQNWPDGLLELLRKCWSFKPEDRPDVRKCAESVNVTLSLIERLHEEVIRALGSSFIAGERLQPRPDLTLREAGNFTTKKAELLPSGDLVVVKEINLREIHSVSSRVDFLKCLASQRTAFSSLTHENILKFMGYSARDYFETVSLVTPNIVNGNLANYMHTVVDMNGKLELARDAMNGLQYLHNREPPLVHGNITPFNVLINETGNAVLCDVGLTVIDWHPIAIAPRQSVRWCSPEVNLGDPAVVQSDIWSWACIVLQLVTGDPPYSYLQNEDQIKAAMSSRRGVRLTPEPFHELDDIPDVLVRLLRRCWDFNFFQRPKIYECADALNSILTMDLDAPSGAEEQAVIPLSDDDISRFITSVSPQAICISGRFGDVFRGIHKTIGEVALKRLRIGGAAVDEQAIRRFEREADTWRRLEHPHVLRFLGTYKPEAHLYFVSPFMQNGTLLEYVNDRPGVNRVRLLYETSDAVAYLHRESIVHGDIKASNLLISDDGHVLLCDFGLAKSTYSHTSTALKGAGTFRWQSPELWNNEPRSFASDGYAFSMTIVEVLTGLPPFSHLENEVAVLMAVYQMDERPLKIPMEYNGVSYENVWRVAEACWPKSHE